MPSTKRTEAQLAISGVNDLATLYPDLAKEWDVEKNGGLKANMILPVSNSSYWWACSCCGHKWEAQFSKRQNGIGCPVCSKKKKAEVLVKERGSLAETHPQLMEEWDWKKNKDLDPNLITSGNSKKAWWICPNGHSYFASITNRAQGHGCPYCTNRKILYGFNDLETINPEVAEEWDYEKNAPLKPSEVIAGNNNKFWWKCKICGYEWQASVNSRTQGNGCFRCAIAYRAKLHSKADQGVNDLQTTHPLLAQEWDYEKNSPLTPKDIKAGSNKKVWWKCKNGHEYETMVANRTGSKRAGCPYCSGKRVLKGFNDLATINPDIVSEWNYEKNAPLKPSDFTVGSNKKAWWKCNLCGHEWQSAISSRSQGNGCPNCAKERKSSFPEQAIFFYIKKQFPDALNDDRETIGMELDIYVPSLKIAIEYDGVLYHSGQKAIDREIKKNDLCVKQGILLIRVREDDAQYDDCATCIRRHNASSLKDLDRVIREVFETISSNITQDIDTARDFYLIQAQYVILAKENSLEALFPEIAK